MVVVLPTPPFWLHMEMTRAGPCSVSGLGSGSTGIGRPVGPSGRSSAGSSAAVVGAISGWASISGRAKGSRSDMSFLSGTLARGGMSGALDPELNPPIIAKSHDSASPRSVAGGFPTALN